MRVVLLMGLLVGLIFTTGATAMAVGDGPGAALPVTLPAPSEPALGPEEGLPARPAAQVGVAIVNGIGIQTQRPTCGVPFTVHVNVANPSGQGSLPGTVSLQNIHRGTGNVNFTASQGYPNMPANGNFVVVFQVLVNSYVSEGQQFVASTNGNTFSVKYNLERGNCPRTSSSDVNRPPAAGQTLRVQHSGKCLDVPGGSRNAVTTVQQFTCTGNDNQSWSIQATGDGFYRIVSRFSGMCLDVQGASQSTQALVQQFPCTGGDNQSFSFHSVGGGNNLVIAKHSGLCIDVRGASTADTTLIQQFSCHGNTNQQWIIR